METGKSTIKDIFGKDRFENDRVFNVPIYQRAYSWKKEDNLKDFLTDIVNQHPERSYFLGSFLFHTEGTRNGFSIVDIVDGQQRLTTFIIFMNELIKQLIVKETNLDVLEIERIFIKDDDVFKLEMSNEDSAFLHNNILSQVDSQVQKTNTLSQRLLVEAKEYFNVELGKYDLTILEKIYRTSIDADILLYVVDKINTATQIFELLNDRGRKLTDLESIKSFLMYNAGIVSNNPDQVIKNIQIEFSEIYRIIERYDLNDRDVLRYHTIAFERCPADYQEKPKEFIKSKIIKLVNDGESRAEALREIQEYAIRLKSSFQIYSKIQDDKNNNFELSQLFMIGRVAPFYPILMYIYKSESNRFNALLSSINRFTFRASLAGLRSNGESYLYTKLRNNEDVIALIDEFISGNWWNINQRALEAIEYVNYYEWLSKNSVRYILFSYENKMRKEKGYSLLGMNEYFTSIEREKLSIEHISAKKAKSVEYDDEFNTEYKHNIGNLVIDFVAPNSSKGNKNTKDKMIDFKLAPLMSQNELDEAVCNWEDVDAIKSFIKDRESRLKLFIKKQFQF